MKPRYLLFYVARRRKSRVYRVEARDKLPADNVLVATGRPHHQWWYLALNEDGVYVRPRGSKFHLSGLGYKHWAGQLPAQWLDLVGNLRDGNGTIVFEAPLTFDGDIQP